ncbi:hypothetical protein Taro_054486 [Colocasia esculenta]|uniref:BAG family molecular chaperone regulator 1 n=1 Tax=Colocasia esculenta TaxID=4460 RepID=A0A843XQ67_COLES|nr:hypothetical protein [Colocasia esculenta]
MMKMVTKAPSFGPTKEAAYFAASPKSGGSPPPEDVEWETRPGGMLVQKRNPDAAAGPPAPTIRVRVKYGAAHHEIYLSSQASFGELKKLLTERTGLHPQDQKLLFKGKEKESAAFLDISGVKDRSKVVLVEDSTAQARRFLEMRKAAKMEKAAKSISQISLEVDKLATKVSQLESIVAKGKRVTEGDVVAVIEELMNQLLKLDGVAADGDVKLQRRVQVRRVQKYVETLDVIKIKNSTPRGNTQMQPPLPLPKQQQQHSRPHHYQQQQPRQQQHQEVRQKVHQPPVTVTTNWETFDLLSGPPSTSTPPTFAPVAPTAAAPIARFEWELF